jgi:hypothetical protein
LFNGANDELLSYAIDPAWRDMVGRSSSSELAILPLAYHKTHKELRVAVPTVFPVNTRGEWILDLNRTNALDDEGNRNGPAWFGTDRPVGGYIQWDGNEVTAGNQGRIFSWSPTIVKLFEERTGTSADGSDLQMEYDGYMLPFGLQMARIIDSYLEYQPSSGTLTVDLKVDGKLVGAQNFSVGSSLTRYGVAVYGVDVYSGAADRTTLPIMWPDTAEGRACQLLIKYTGQGDFKAFTYGHNVFAEPIPRGF